MRGALLLIALTCVGLTIACKPADQAPSTRAIKVDRPGLLYVWRDVERGTQTASLIKDVPPLRRDAVGVWHTDWAHLDDEHVYIVDLSAARPGAVVQARWTPRRVLIDQMYAAHAGADRGYGTAWMARELANLHPSSARQRAARRNREALEELRPRFAPTYDEHLKMLRERAASERALSPPNEAP